MKQVQDNPTVNRSFTISALEITSTGASGTVTAAGSSALIRGQSVLLKFDGGTAQGFTSLGEYFVIPVNSGSFKIAASVSDALTGTYVATASGDAGAGDVYPNYELGGLLYVGTGGNVNARGIENASTGATAFSLHKNIADGSMLPMMLKDVSASGTTATDLVCWVQ